MANFYSEGQDWRCPRCKRHILLAQSDMDDVERLFHLPRIEPRWYVERLQTIVCRNCNEFFSTLGLYRAQVHNGQPQRYGHNSKVITNHAYRELMVYPLHVEESYDADLVLAAINQDLQEASAIVDLSPRASAVLSRRIVQSVMRDFYEVGKHKDLHSEIEAARNKMPEALYEALMSIKSLGNIGAHPERDIDLIVTVDGEEAALLLSVVRYLIESTYIKRADEERRLAALKALGDEKRAQRKQGA